MKVINGFEDCLNYVSHLGVIPQIKSPGWIPNYQDKICNLCDKLRDASVQFSWYHDEFKPFKVRFNRHGRYFVVKRELTTEKGWAAVSAIVPIR
jgi:hypothetical protein